MPGDARPAVDKKEIGARIKRLRKEAGLRQWQLAEMIGATQPAIHMYERGVLPEPKRLLELARIGNTTVEWILTGRHWENGSEDMHRVPTKIYDLAFLFDTYDDEERQTLEEALRIIHNAVKELRKSGPRELEEVEVEEVARSLKEMSEGTLQALNAAIKVHRAVYRTALDEAAERIRRSGLGADGATTARRGPGAASQRRPIVRTGAASMEALRGNIYRLDGSLAGISEILKDRTLRKEFEDTLGKLMGKLESKKSKSTRMKSARRSS